MLALAEAQAEADRLQREVAQHKSASRYHRAKIREKRQRLDGLIAACAAQNITITINTQPQGGHGGNHDTTSPGARKRP